MGDAPKPDARPPTPDLIEVDERDARIDELLLSGLEHYFEGRYDEAINIWGRVLFLDRSHARARAYIERARSATAEIQRRSDELLHAGVAAFQRGDESAARELLASAVEEGAPHEEAVGYLGRLERLAVTPQTGRPAGRRTPSPPRAIDPAVAAIRPAAPVRALPILGLVVLATAVVMFAASRDLLKPLIETPWGGGRPEASSLPPPELLSLPRAAETTIARARTLFATGHLRDALVVLDTIAPADPSAPEAERLRGQIQRALLEAAGLDAHVAGTAPPAEGGRE